MNNSQIADLITSECKKRSIKTALLLQECGINHSFISDIRHKNRAPSVDKISVIADYLGVSVDYLLGRTDEPNTNEPAVNVSGSQQNPPTEQARELDNEISTLLLRLSLRERVELMSMIYKYVDEHSGK